jgi:hypothetical protein
MVKTGAGVPEAAMARAAACLSLPWSACSSLAGFLDELAVRLQVCRGMLQCESMLPHGLQDELAVRLEFCRGILQCASNFPHCLQDGPAVCRERRHGISQCGPPSIFPPV